MRRTHLLPLIFLLGVALLGCSGGSIVGTTVSPTATPQPSTLSLKEILALTPRPSGMDVAMQEISALVQQTNETLGDKYFTQASFVDAGARLELTVEDHLWYGDRLKPPDKERLMKTFGEAYARIAAKNGLPERQPDASNRLTTSFVDRSGREVAHYTNSEVKVVR